MDKAIAQQIKFDGLCWNLRQRMKHNVLVYDYYSEFIVVEYKPDVHPSHAYFVVGRMDTKNTIEGFSDDTWESTSIEDINHGQRSGYAQPIKADF